jgi:hypothetical protein
MRSCSRGDHHFGRANRAQLSQEPGRTVVGLLAPEDRNGNRWCCIPYVAGAVPPCLSSIGATKPVCSTDGEVQGRIRVLHESQEIYFQTRHG